MLIVVCYKYLIMHVHIVQFDTFSEAIAARTLPFPISWSPPPLVFDDENVLLLKYNQSRITQARDKQVEDKQDQSMKGCSDKELDKENYQR